MADPRQRQGVKLVDPTTDANEAGVDASGNLQVILAANDGVDIGDVDVTSVIPGVAATELGKAVSSASGATDTGVASLAVRDDVLGALTELATEYVHLRVDANGALWTHDDVLEAAIAGSELQVDIVAPLPTGTNEIGDIRAITTSITPGVGNLFLGKAENVALAAGDVGVATMAVQDAVLSALGSVDNDYTQLRVNANGALWVEQVAGGSGTSAVDSAPFTVATDSYTPVGGIFDDAAPGDLTEGDGGAVRMSAVREMYTNIRDGAGGERSANVTAANELNVILGSNTGVDIGDVDVTSVIPGVGATDLGKAEDTLASTGDTGVAVWGIRNDIPTVLSDTDLDYTGIAVDSHGHLQVDVLTGGGSDTPTGDDAAHSSSTNTAAGGVFEVDSTDFGTATKKLSGVEFSASVPLKCEVMSVDDGAETVLTTLFSQAGDSVVWRPPHRDYFEVAFTANAGFDGFRLQITNNDNSQAADVYGTVYSED